MAMPAPYQRPVLSRAEEEECSHLALMMTMGKSMREIRLEFIQVLQENAMLTHEVNEHREARGLQPLATFHAPVGHT